MNSHFIRGYLDKDSSVNITVNFAVGFVVISRGSFLAVYAFGSDTGSIATPIIADSSYTITKLDRVTITISTTAPYGGWYSIFM